MTPDQTNEFRLMLQAERERLSRELGSVATRDPNMPGDWDARFPKDMNDGGRTTSLEDQADIREEYESDIAQEQTLELRLRAVNEALARAENGTYGTCAACGAEIPIDRLRANPAAAYHIEHEPR